MNFVSVMKLELDGVLGAGWHGRCAEGVRRRNVALCEVAYKGA
jgi:hypothetical protein